jgi:DNA-binding protein HU-beta
VNKSDLINAVAKEANLTKKAASSAVEATFSVIQQALAKGEKVTLVGFGTFEVRKRKGRQGVNPATKAKITIPAKTVPAFKPGKALKEAVK